MASSPVRPRLIRVEREEFRFSVGDGGDFSWDDIDVLLRNRNHENQLRQGPKMTTIGIELLKATVMAKRTFPGSELLYS